MVPAARLATCPMVAMELLWTATDQADLAELRTELQHLPAVPIAGPEWNRAIEVFAALGRAGPLNHRRVRIPDLLIAAAAELAGMAVVHYDRDFEVIGSITGQPMRALAPIGSL
jgi:predicted nucleic acid-binding protein